MSVADENAEATFIEALIHALGLHGYRSFSYATEAKKRAVRAINQRLKELHAERAPGAESLPAEITTYHGGTLPGWGLALQRLSHELVCEPDERLSIRERAGIASSGSTTQAAPTPPAVPTTRRSYPEVRLARLYRRPQTRQLIYDLCLLLPEPRKH